MYAVTCMQDDVMCIVFSGRCHRSRTATVCMYDDVMCMQDDVTSMQDDVTYDDVMCMQDDVTSMQDDVMCIVFSGRCHRSRTATVCMYVGY